MVSAAVRLATFNIPQYARMTMVDEMDFGSLGEKKKAIFCVIPVDDSSMNYLVGMLYTQCFQALYRRADEKHNGRLPVPVRVIQDEWANVAQPESYPKILATCRSYNIGLNIIVQNIQQIKALYEKEWESIIGNCDTLLFLGGGNEPTSLEFIVKLLGKETIATRTRGETKGRSGSSSTNFQQTGRDLMTIDEVRKLDTHKAILFIRGEDPVLDKKYNIKRHPNIKLTTDGKAKPYNREFLEYICVDDIGDRFKPNYITSQFPRLLERNGFRKIRFHDLRHSCASLLLASGVPMKHIQEWLGHSDFSTTANIYAHLDYSSKLTSASAMESNFHLGV